MQQLLIFYIQSDISLLTPVLSIAVPRKTNSAALPMHCITFDGISATAAENAAPAAEPDTIASKAPAI